MVVNPELVAKAEALAVKKLEKKRGEIGAKYPHAILGTLGFLPEFNKYSVQIKCVDCGCEREVFEQDLHQVCRCEECHVKFKKARKKAKKAGERAALLAAREALVGGE